MLHAVIMAGGSGTRFWPESRDARPKQLLSFSDAGTLLQDTLARLGSLVTPERVLIATNARLAAAVAAQLPALPPSAILGEPCKRDTAPCIGLAALRIARQDPDAVLVVMPSDHVIESPADFQRAVRGAVDLVQENPERIVTFGIRPSYPAESFGYIERDERLASGHDLVAWKVRRFREKPKLPQAREFVQAGTFYWNSGIFVWRAETILSALREFQPDMLAHLERIEAAVGTLAADAVFAAEFAAIKGVSIDYAVLEHWKEVAVIEAPFAWDDVGSWQALARLRGTDEHGNTVVGAHLGVDTQGTIVRGPADHLIVTLGLRDCLVVHTPDATLVANKHSEEAVRDVVKQLKELGWSHLL